MNCNHEWKMYQGLVESFEYCSTCNVKKGQEKEQLDIDKPLSLYDLKVDTAGTIKKKRAGYSSLEDKELFVKYVLPSVIPASGIYESFLLNQNELSEFKEKPSGVHYPLPIQYASPEPTPSVEEKIHNKALKQATNKQQPNTLFISYQNYMNLETELGSKIVYVQKDVKDGSPLIGIRMHLPCSMVNVCPSEYLTNEEFAFCSV